MAGCTIDHLVVACADLAQGDAWLLARLGVAAQPGGRHLTMGTHNRLLRLGPRTYLELLALDPAGRAERPRWFGLDTPAVRARMAQSPFLLTWAAACADLDAALARLPALGEVQHFRRDAFAWRLTVPVDGRLNCDGVLPALIAWEGEAHPCDRLEDRGIAFERLRLAHPQAAEFAPALAALGVGAEVEWAAGDPALQAELRVGGRRVTID